MSDDLVKRLRWLQAQYENAGQILAEDFKDAADEIEEYERAFSNLHREYDARGDRIEELEAKLAKADPAAIWREAMEAALSSLNDTGMYWTGLREGQLFQCEIEKIRAIPNPYEVKE